MNKRSSVFMQKLHPSILLIISALLLSSRKNGQLPLDHLYVKYKKDKVIISKLKSFETKGYGNILDNAHLSPRKITEEAKKYLGVKHCMGGRTQKCLDCSGLLLVVFKKFNVDLPHISEEQARYGQIIGEHHKLRKGDLVFFKDTYKSDRLITHSGIMLDKNTFIHTSSKNGVMISKIEGDPYWEQKFILGTRIF